MHFCGTATDPLLPPNVVDVSLTEAALARRGRRHLEVSYSSCGLCAKEAVSEIVRKVPPVQSHLTVAPEALLCPDGAPAGGADRLPGDRRHPRRGPGQPRTAISSSTPKTWGATTPWIRSSAGLY